MKSSRKLLTVPLICLSLGLGTAAWADGGSTNTDPNTVVATVNGKAIHNSDIDDYIRDHRLNPQQATNRSAILNDIIARDLVRADALKKGLNKRPDVVAEMKKAETDVLLNAAVRQAVMDNPITQQELKQTYQQQLPNLQPTEYKASNILLKTKAEAEAVIKELDRGANFAKLAKEKSIDPSAKKNGGELGWFTGQRMPPAFMAAVAELKKGHFTKAPVHSPYGWHVIKLEGVRTRKAPTLKEIEPQLREYLDRMHIQEYVQKLRAAAKVDIKSQQ